MGKYVILAAALALTLLATAPAARAATELTTTCATTTLQYWTTGTSPTHDGHNIQQRIQPHTESAYEAAFETIAQDSTHNHTYYAKRPQAQKVQYRVQLTNGGSVVETSDVDTCDLTSTIHFSAGAEFDDCFVSDFWDPTDVAECGGTSSNDDDGEWAQQDYDLGGFGSNVETSNPTALKGVRSYVCSAQTELTDGGPGDRCEYAMANADEANISTDNVWGAGNSQEIWYALAFRLDGTPACLTSGDFDCGAVSQEKQVGQCRRPINSMAVASSATGQLYLEQHNDDRITCASGGSSRTLWAHPISTNTWIKVLRHYKFSTSASTGYVETYIDADGDAFVDWDAITSGELHSDVTAAGLTVESPNVPTDIGTVNSSTAARVKTWTAKNDAGEPSSEVNANTVYCNADTKWPCVHARVGIYRNPAITGTTTVNHDSVTSGTDAGDVVDVAF